MYDEIENIADSTDYETAVDEAAVREILEQLSVKFKSLTQVRPTCQEVEILLEISGTNSWVEFQKKFKSELEEFFSTSTPIQETNIDKTLLDRMNRKRALIKNKIVEVEKSTKTFQNQVKQLQAKLSQAELDYLATEGMEWDEESCKKNKAAERTIQLCKTQLKTLETKNPEGQLKQLYFNLRHTEGCVKFAEQATQGEFRIYVNTGDPKSDARLYQKLGETCIWEINRLMDREIQIEKAMSEERFSGSDFNMARMSDLPFEDTGGGVYRSNIERLHEVREEMEGHLCTYAACQHGYETAAKAWQPRYDTEWFPQWPEMATALQQARTRMQQATISRARNQLDAARGLLKR